MAFKLAISTAACPGWSLEEVASRGAAMGCDGVELHVAGSGGGGPASDPTMTDAKKTAELLRSHGLMPVCLSTPWSLHHRDAEGARTATAAIERAIDTAGALGCPCVRVLGRDVSPGESRRSVTEGKYTPRELSIARPATRSSPRA